MWKTAIIHSRLHGSDSYRVPWLFGDEAVDVCRAFARLKARLMPYLYSLAAETHREGVPAMRAMLLEFPDDLGAEDCDRQYMLGDALLVAPVMREDNIGEYYLPRGTWTHLLTGEVRNEPGWHREEYGFDSLPLFVRENTLLPLGDCEDRADYDYEKNVTLRLYALCDRAQRTVCDRRGNAAFTVTAERNGNSILIRTEGGAPGLRIRLMNTPAVHNLSGAHLETEAGDVLLTACKTEIHFEL